MADVIRFDSSVGTISDTGFAMRRGVSFDQWLEAGAQLLRLHSGMLMVIGDLLNEGEIAFGERYAQVIPEYESETFRVAKWVSKRVPAVIRITGLRWGHYQVIAGLEREAQVETIKRASENGWTVRQTREAVKAIKGAIGTEAKPKSPDCASVPARDVPLPGEPGSAPTHGASDLGEFITADEVAEQERGHAEYVEALESSAGDYAGQIKTLTARLAAAESARDRYMNECAAMRRQLAARDREIERLKKKAA